MEEVIQIVSVIVVIVVVLVYSHKENLKKDKAVMITCPRCGYSGTKNTYDGAASSIIGCVLLLLFLIPGIFYYAILGGKIVCPRCRNTF